ncbi:serine hydrolase [Chitinimonas lacunae]|uniref:Beta-lactamase n=1 Tax=Chitinimonas lacunae TaxID=1963018 RepID=A0ABV8MV38_9NEIS
MKQTIVSVALATLGLGAVAAEFDPALQVLLESRLRAEEQPFCLGAVVVENQVSRYGMVCPEGSRADIDRSLFEIGSVSKVYTGALLALAIERGELLIDDKLAARVPPGTALGSWGGVTLRQLLTHTAGLPRLPGNLTITNPRDPYADFSATRLYAGLADTQPLAVPGARYEYSNLGYMLLGDLLARRAGQSFPTLLQSRLATPLGLGSTFVEVPSQRAADYLSGHDYRSSQGTRWRMDPALAGAGGIKSSLADLGRFMAAQLEAERGEPSTPLLKALRRSHSELWAGVSARLAYGWHRAESAKAGTVWWHNGQTGGFNAYVAFAPGARRAVAVVANADSDIADVGRHLLDPTVPMREPRPDEPIPQAKLQQYVGEYMISPGLMLTVSGGNGRLFAQATGQPGFELFEIAPDRLRADTADVQIVFRRGADDRIDGLMLTQGGRDTAARRVGEGRLTDIAVSQAGSYVGRYQLSPTVIATVSADKGRVKVGLTGQPTFEVYAEAPDRFFYRVVPAKLEFRRDANGRVVALTLVQNGQMMEGKRMP